MPPGVVKAGPGSQYNDPGMQADMDPSFAIMHNYTGVGVTDTRDIGFVCPGIKFQRPFTYN